MYCTIYVGKTKVLIRCLITAQLICVFVWAYAKSRFSHDASQMSLHIRNSDEKTCLGVSNKVRHKPECVAYAKSRLSHDGAHIL